MASSATSSFVSGAARTLILLLCAAPSCREKRDPALLGPPDPATILESLGVEATATVHLETDEGSVTCDLDSSLAPRGVSLFLGLATGRAAWTDPKTGARRDDPMYRDLTFHRSIPGVMVQSGCPIGDGSGSPGYRIEVEADASDRARLRAPGVLALARYTPPPYRIDPEPPPSGHVLGSQFFIGLTDMSHLAGQTTVLGRCRNLDVVARLARDVRKRPSPPLLRRIRVGAPTE